MSTTIIQKHIVDESKDVGRKCRYCKKPITFIELNSHLSAGACVTPGCVYKNYIHVKDPQYTREIEIQ